MWQYNSTIKCLFGVRSLPLSLVDIFGFHRCCIIPKSLVPIHVNLCLEGATMFSMKSPPLPHPAVSSTRSMYKGCAVRKPVPVENFGPLTKSHRSTHRLPAFLLYGHEDGKNKLHCSQRGWFSFFFSSQGKAFARHP